MNTEIDINEVRTSGGGGKSALWRQMQADMFGCDVCTINSNEGGALGVAILAMVGTGEYCSIEQACVNIIKREKISKPNGQNVSIYKKGYELYTSLYPTLKDSFLALQTGGV